MNSDCMEQFAPVAIHTLNRYEHLKKCIESLAKNKLAQKTELFISVDYPPNEKYRNGYEKVVEFVSSGIKGFAGVNVYIQETNLGSARNSLFLNEEVFKKYDRIIKSEDDNVFSVNFLEYMNMYLDKYSEDSSIYAVCGYVYPVCLKDLKGETFKSDMFSAWGYGTWKAKMDARKSFGIDDIRNAVLDGKYARIWRKRNRHIYNEAVYVAAGKHYYYRGEKAGDFVNFPDFMLCIYLYISGKYVIVPAYSKVRNIGNDGTGEHCNDKSEDLYAAQGLDERNGFEDCPDAESLSDRDRYVIENYVKADLRSNVMVDLIRLKMILNSII